MLFWYDIAVNLCHAANNQPILIVEVGGLVWVVVCVCLYRWQALADFCKKQKSYYAGKRKFYNKSPTKKPQYASHCLPHCQKSFSIKLKMIEAFAQVRIKNHENQNAP